MNKPREILVKVPASGPSFFDRSIDSPPLHSKPGEYAYIEKEAYNKAIEALKWYAGNSVWKEKSEWSNNSTFLPFNKFGVLCERMSSDHVAIKTLKELGEK